MALPGVRRSTDPVRPGTTSWEPFREFDDVRTRMERLMTQAFGDTVAGVVDRWAPPVDLEETDDRFIVEVDLPGVSREDVTVELRDNELAVHGEITERERTGVVRRRMRHTGEFDYRVTLPGEVDDEHVEAKLTDGVLRIEVPKTTPAHSRRIEVSEG